MSKIGSWVNSITTRFQIKRDQDRAAAKNELNPNEQPDVKADRLTKSILDIMQNKPRGSVVDDELGSKPPTKTNNKP